MYSNILIPLDCSDVDYKIIKQVEMLCDCMKPTVSLLRVLHIHTRDAMMYSESETMQYLEKISRIFVAKGVQVDCYMEFGDPDKVIIRKALELNCDLIAFAAHGHKTLLDFLLGSVIDKVRHNINIPILMINAS